MHRQLCVLHLGHQTMLEFKIERQVLECEKMLKIKSFERVHRHLCVLHSRHSTTEPATKQTARTKTLKIKCIQQQHNHCN